MLSQQDFKQHRQKLLDQLPDDSIAIITTNPEYPRTQDCPHRFRPNGNFYYLTGFTEPEAIAVLSPNREEGEYILFNRPRNPEQELWDGYRAGQTGAVQDFGADQAFPFDDFDLVLPDLLEGKTTIYFQFNAEMSITEDLFDLGNTLSRQRRQGVATIEHFSDVDHLIHELRLIKSDAEITIMRQAAAINIAAHRRAMERCQAGLTEIQLFSELNYVYNQHNCLNLAYDPVVATGKNACILHYRADLAELKAGDLVLLDVGQEFQLYASDITRTLPVDGKFTEPQRLVYEMVLKAQMQLIEMVKPGIRFNELQRKAVELITEGLIELGLLQGDVDSLIAEQAYVEFYPHGVSHWIGSDVHDVSDYKIDGEWRKLQPGMALTIEPGIYIQANNENVAEKWRGIGIRIEDDIVVTKTSCENLTAALPKTVNEITQLMNRR